MRKVEKAKPTTGDRKRQYNIENEQMHEALGEYM